MNITLKNIGTIEQASFDLDKDLIVFIGPNNTGKTYAAYCLYGCYRKQNDIIIKTEANNDAIFNNVYEKGFLNLWEYYILNKNEIIKEYSKYKKNKLSDIFDSAESFFDNSSIEFLLNDETIHAKIKESYTGHQRKHENVLLTFVKNSNIDNVRIDFIYESNDIKLKNEFNSETHKKTTNIIFHEYALERIIDIIFQTPYFATAERIAINLFSKPLSNNRNNLVTDFISISKSKNVNADSIFSKEKLYPLPIRDSLTIAYNLNEYQKYKSEYTNLADYIESEILHGKVTVSELGELQYVPEMLPVNSDATVEIISAKYGIDDNFTDCTNLLKPIGFKLQGKKVTNKLLGGDPYRNRVKQLLLSWKVNNFIYSRNFWENETIDINPFVSPLDIHLSASMVKSLSSLVFYFKHIAKKGDFFIIDEPEINLHPDNQRLVARVLAKLSKLGVKVIISTHSDYIIRELNNLIMLNKEHPETQSLREKYGYDETEILDHKRVGAYLFKDHTAKEIEVNESGMEAATIDEEINKLNNTATDIYWTLFED